MFRSVIKSQSSFVFQDENKYFEIKTQIFKIVYPDITTYGFEVCLEREGEVDCQRVDGVTDSEQIANEWFDILVRNNVTPCHLDYVIDELVSAL